ncbi:MAG: hypothetical protein UV61_C0009G0024 [Candidatus Gottesmanbacteria bacterium GW2011_GWB1_43_11]|uniref:Uncharacterized protein n=1 Tax=Candidatus Gottesmanbacteria bacterium GW2011_GWB1_43_11 TaxID=1618446 RepID=A0A0G1CLW3_9BACT|nr:MAG: hypothetical protein UV17_C0065G0007 [Candidatus Gottesmanbacteria bacterium GW2011_GWA1_42_26]KKS81378.1 MAG: hypothetical protein UV55_C0015G0024 [Candidatus Gottesmanbacteria bacterium GW2011_GWC1_43_10]KKS86497.1 MAG: hypothetical protein UV61_C0009G0024 [Candidatus Gottesmanbacteria bacterium GW2011_GWB1_43_11]
MKKFYLDERIREKFQLFKGFRSQQEDQELYEHIYEACFAEILIFLKDSLEEFTFKQFQRELATIDDKEALNLTYSVIIEYLRMVTDGAYKIDRRLDHLVNNLLIQSMKNLSKK